MLIFVNEEDANRYYVPPNTSTLLMDKDNPIFYIKTSDALGRTTMEKFTFTKVEPPAPPQYVTMEEFANLNAKIDALLAATISSPTSTSTGGTTNGQSHLHPHRPNPRVIHLRLTRPHQWHELRRNSG